MQICIYSGVFLDLPTMDIPNTPLINSHLFQQIGTLEARIYLQRRSLVVPRRCERLLRVSQFFVRQDCSIPISITREKFPAILWTRKTRGSRKRTNWRHDVAQWQWTADWHRWRFEICIRTKYIVRTVQIKHDDTAIGQWNIDTAHSMLKEIKPGADVLGWTGDDYDLLVTLWPRWFCRRCTRF